MIHVMTYDGLLLAGVAAELRHALVGGRISKIKQPEQTEIALTIRNHGADFRLLMSANAQFPRVYLTVSVAPGPERAPNFLMALRKHIGGAFITGVEQQGFDRILRLRLESPDGNRTTLVHEIMGKHSNLILVSDPGYVLAAAKVVTSAVSRERQIIPGREYTPPPGGKSNPLEVTEEEFHTIWMSAFGDEMSVAAPPDVKGWLVKSFSGFGPLLANELTVRAGGQGTSLEDVWGQLVWLRELVASENYSPIVAMDERGRMEIVYPTPLKHIAAERQHGRAVLSEALDAAYRSAVGTAVIEAQRGQLCAMLKRAISSREHAMTLHEKAIADGADAERYKTLGDLIISQMGKIAKGSSSVTVTDYYDQSLAEIEIPLEPALTPRENAERYFKRSRKTRDAAAAAADRVVEIASELGQLRRAEDEARSAESVEALQKMRQALAAKGLLREQLETRGPGKAAAQPFDGMRIRRVMSLDGWEILVGENSLSNDYLTTKVASPNDLWFHARAVKGAHVVVRTNNRPAEIPPGTLRQAAELAALGSDAKHSSLVAVDYTLRKFVRKPRGSAPGFVRYQNEKTMDVTPLR